MAKKIDLTRIPELRNLSEWMIAAKNRIKDLENLDPDHNAVLEERKSKDAEIDEILEHIQEMIQDTDRGIHTFQELRESVNDMVRARA
jgi:predicted nuclease with TOPRIM domain